MKSITLLSSLVVDICQSRIVPEVTQAQYMERMPAINEGRSSYTQLEFENQIPLSESDAALDLDQENQVLFSNFTFYDSIENLYWANLKSIDAEENYLIIAKNSMSEQIDLDSSKLLNNLTSNNITLLEQKKLVAEDGLKLNLTSQILSNLDNTTKISEIEALSINYFDDYLPFADHESELNECLVRFNQTFSENSQSCQQMQTYYDDLVLVYREMTELSSAVITGWILLCLSVLLSFLIYVNGTDPNCVHYTKEQLSAKEKQDLIWKPFKRQSKSSSVQNEGGEDQQLKRRKTD